MNHWAAVRIGLIAFAGISSALGRGNSSATGALGWEAVAASFLFFPALVCVGLCVLLPFGKAKLRWNSPSWDRNPFNFSQPEQFFHMAGYAMVATGVGLWVAEILAGGNNFAHALASALFGAGILIGLQILELVAVKKK